MRKTAFPNVWIESIKSEKPPFDEPGVIQEFVGRGATREFKVPKKADELTKATIGEILDSFEKSIGPLRDTYRLKYNLLVRVPVSNPLTERAIRMRARSFVRLKNPFEPDLISVSPVSSAGKTYEDMVGDFYKVAVTVTK